MTNSKVLRSNKLPYQKPFTAEGAKHKIVELHMVTTAEVDAGLRNKVGIRELLHPDLNLRVKLSSLDHMGDLLLLVTSCHYSKSGIPFTCGPFHRSNCCGTLGIVRLVRSKCKTSTCPCSPLTPTHYFCVDIFGPQLIWRTLKPSPRYMCILHQIVGAEELSFAQSAV